jgi:hypothetical protein
LFVVGPLAHTICRGPLSTQEAAAPPQKRICYGIYCMRSKWIRKGQKLQWEQAEECVPDAGYVPAGLKFHLGTAAAEQTRARPWRT